MTVPLLGKDCYLYINTGVLGGDGSGTWTEIGGATDVTVDKTKDTIEATDRESSRGGWKRELAGLKQFKISTDMHRAALGETENAGTALVLSAFADNSVVEIVVADGNINTGTAVPATFAECIVGGGSESQATDSTVALSVEFTNADVPIDGDYTTGTFTPDA